MTEQETTRYARQRAQWADHADVLDALEEDMRRQLSRPAPPPCPAWCTERNHDGYDDMVSDPGRQIRNHLVDVSPAVVIEVAEIREPDDSTHLTDPTIAAEVPPELSAAEAEALGLSLLRAAAQLRVLQGRVAA